MGMFLKIDGVSGSSQDPNHVGAMDVLAWSWGMSQSEVAHLPSRVSQSMVQNLDLVKYADEASPKLQLLCLSGEHLRSAELICSTGSSDRPFLTIELFDLVLSSISAGGSDGEDRFTENISLNFTNVEYGYTTFERDGTNKTETMRWNLRTEKGSVESARSR